MGLVVGFCWKVRELGSEWRSEVGGRERLREREREREKEKNKQGGLGFILKSVLFLFLNYVQKCLMTPASISLNSLGVLW